MEGKALRQILFNITLALSTGKSNKFLFVSKSILQKQNNFKTNQRYEVSTLLYEINFLFETISNKLQRMFGRF